MLQVKLYFDGSGLVTFSRTCPDGTQYNSHRAMEAEEVARHLRSRCLNDPKGCGTCLVCKTQEANTREKEAPPWMHA